ncbi:hypothetical protein [Hyalangium versicolor]|uniref:hypothetical protein n=1 Tax=Hyalangium versicolor TaxID=2861190 RepID=UPI001CCF9094|nr:hypothetical protein [Hyalangium versicolor]
MKAQHFLIAAILVVATGGTAHANRKIDAFTDPVPPQTLPGTSITSELLWVGTLSGVSKTEDKVSQSGLSGVMGEKRTAALIATTPSNLVTTSIFDGSLSYAAGTGKSGRLVLEYGGTTQLNKNLSSELAFELEINGDMDDSASPRPVLLTVRVGSNGLTRYGTAQVSLARDGVYQIPFSRFSGVDFTDVDYISFDFDASAVSSIDYTLIGGLRTADCLQTGTVVADIVVDDFIAKLPQSYLPGNGMADLMWAGTFNNTQKASAQETQTNLLGTLGGQRKTLMAASDVTNFLTTSIANHELSYATGSATSGRLTLQYGATGDLNANLSRARAFELEINGDLDDSSPIRPVLLTTTVRSNSVIASYTTTLLQDGRYYVEFSRFPGVNFADVDFVEFYFNASQVQAIDFRLQGGLRASACIR